MKTSPRCRLLLALSLLATTAAPPLRALDFTLHRVQATSGEFKTTKTYFLDGDSKIFIDLPRDWKVSDNPAALDCLPAHADCHVLIQQAGSQPWPFDEPSKIALRKRVLEAIPAGAKDIKALPEELNLIPLDGWSSLEVAHNYEFYGQKMRRAVLFFNLPEHRVWQVSITAPEENFAAIHEQTRLMLYDLFEPAKMLSGTALQRYNDGISD